MNTNELLFEFINCFNLKSPVKLLAQGNVLHASWIKDGPPHSESGTICSFTKHSLNLSFTPPAQLLLQDDQAENLLQSSCR